MEIIKLTQNHNKMQEALDLCWKTFLKFEAPDYPQEGITEFKSSLEDQKYIGEREFFVAIENDSVIGVIATYNKSHISYFFVDESYQGKGIGKKLYNYILDCNDKEILTVNSSPYAKDIYAHFGFESQGPMQEISGIKFYKMINRNVHKV